MNMKLIRQHKEIIINIVRNFKCTLSGSGKTDCSFVISIYDKLCRKSSGKMLSIFFLNLLKLHFSMIQIYQLYCATDLAKCSSVECTQMLT